VGAEFRDRPSYKFGDEAGGPEVPSVAARSQAAGCRVELRDERADLHAVVGGRLAGSMRSADHHDHAQLGKAPLGERSA
jgi:hypothetical protein